MHQPMSAMPAYRSNQRALKRMMTISVGWERLVIVVRVKEDQIRKRNKG
jgi:hypothetical protein